MLGNTSFFWLHRSIWFSSGVCLQSVDGSALVLKIFFRLRNSASPKLLIMTSLFILRYFEHGQTDWDSQYFKLGGGVLCHHSPRWISLTFGQHPLYSDGNPYICTTTLYEPCYSSLLSPTLLTSTFCFRLTFAYSRAEPPEPHHWFICNRHIYHVCMSRSQAQPCGSITSETSHGMWWKPRQWRF